MLSRVAAQGHGHLDVGVPAAHVDPGDGQGWTALERIPGQQGGSAALTQLIATGLAGTLLRQPFRKGRQDQLAGIDGGDGFSCWFEDPVASVGGELLAAIRRDGWRWMLLSLKPRDALPIWRRSKGSRSLRIVARSHPSWGSPCSLGFQQQHAETGMDAEAADQATHAR